VPFIIDSSQDLNPRSKIAPMIAPFAGTFPCGKTGARKGPFGAGPGREKGEAEMADIEMAAVSAAEPADAEGCFARGMNYSSGAGVAVDLIEAHKWFNIAAMRGHAEAA
jgi:TPR repeat protein